MRTKYKMIAVTFIPYIKVRVPINVSSHGEEYIDCNYKQVEETVLKTIITHYFPITGLEVKFIRHFFGLSMKEFGKIFDVADATICKWEKKRKPLDLSNQVTIRAFVGEKLGLRPTFSELIKISKIDEALTIRAA